MERPLRPLLLLLLALPLMSPAQGPSGERKSNKAARASEPGEAGEGEGTLDRGHIQQVVQQQRLAIRACYEEELLKNPELTGEVTFRFDITRTGRVEGVRVERESLGSPEVLGCLAELLAALHFDAPEGGSVVVRYPLRFRSGG